MQSSTRLSLPVEFVVTLVRASLPTPPPLSAHQAKPGGNLREVKRKKTDVFGPNGILQGAAAGGALSAGGGATDSCQSQSRVLTGDVTHTLVFEEETYDGTDAASVRNARVSEESDDAFGVTFTTQGSSSSSLILQHSGFLLFTFILQSGFLLFILHHSGFLLFNFTFTTQGSSSSPFILHPPLTF
ncbi:hypothetical protein EYF80_023380 [Liparis tanakae]|uniref:Uncharacterized protein n=1 Tax=Liparis tanakae TaxID=230148 RepID=A0A4Z2HNW5_9TELE|nr:hypothetical protein EYF80_023380 [Liparis tanakae]